MGVAFSPDGRLVASASALLGGVLGEIKVWDATTGKCLATLHGQGGYAALNVAFSPDGRRLATGGGSRSKGEITIWDASSWGAK